MISNSNREQWTKPVFWRDLCPELTIEDRGSSNSRNPESNSAVTENAEQHRQNLIRIGYTLVDTPLESTLIQKLLQGIEGLQAANYPASFILLFEETWELAQFSRNTLKRSTHPSNQFHFDILAWYIDDRAKSGFSPHRDRQPEDAKASFHDDDQAKFVTHWIALSDATPQTSCLYVIPKPHDPGYVDGDEEDMDPLQRALPNKNSFQHIRALPRTAGSSVMFTHRIIHWGSARDTRSQLLPPRVAISFVCSDPTFEKPYIDPNYFTDDKTPPFHIRLLLVCAQLLIYYQRFHLSKETIKACYDYCKLHENELEETYRHKCYIEFVNAMKEGKASNDKETTIQTKNTAANQNGKKENDKGNDDDEDAEEAVLEEMLNAEKSGYGEFEDDYDEEMEGEGDLDGGGDDDGIEDDEEEEEGISLFGKADDGPPSKKPRKSRM